MGYQTTQTVELEDVEIEINGNTWTCNVQAQVSVETDCDYGDNGRTLWGSGPSCETDVEELSATCYLYDSKGEEIAMKEIQGDEATKLIDDDEIVERAVEQHNCS